MDTLILETTEKLLDQVGWNLLRELQRDARIGYSELGRRVGLSSPAVAERVRRMEEAGIIKGYHAEIDLERVGLPVVAFILIRVAGTACAETKQLLAQMPEVLECHRLTGADSLLVKVAVPHVTYLEELINQIGVYGETNTSLLLSSQAPKPILGPVAPLAE